MTPRSQKVRVGVEIKSDLATASWAPEAEKD